MMREGEKMISDREWLSKLYKRFGWTWWRVRRRGGFEIRKTSDEVILVKSSDVESFARSALPAPPAKEGGK
jgi:hypothetical protein